MQTERLSHEDVLLQLPERDVCSHKGDFGKLLLICGSRGFTGAPAMAAMGALRSGAGLVFLAVPESIYEIEAVKLDEPIVVPVSDEGGKIGKSAQTELLNMMKNKDAVLIGPGLGQSEGTHNAVKTVLTHFEGPVVLDADGINVIVNHKDIVRGRMYPTVLTPHAGEFQRLGGNVNKDRLDAAGEFAADLGAVVLLKGHNTVITDGTRFFVNPTGNPGMAVGGSGDVLSGIVVSLLGQGLDPLDAAACGAWLHGAAGDICAEEIGQYGMLPTDMLNVLPRLMK